ncbi:MAG: cysteine desulfurase family protein [Albidovulum sp.]|nr:cysteine desulfurase family protein [Albidovulum sp.]
MPTRIYLDWNATAPLRPEARRAMVAAMDTLGNPSSVHAEGRAARAVIERARWQLAAATHSDPEEIVFTSGATEAAGMALAGRALDASGIEHPAVLAWTNESLRVDPRGIVEVEDPAHATLQAANGETGVIQNLPRGIAVTDATQAFGKIPFSFRELEPGCAIISAHKIGGPKGVGALLMGGKAPIAPLLKGGGQETGRRSGTENVVGIAGFGAAAEAAARDLNDGTWCIVRELRDFLEGILLESASGLVFFGNETNRLPNTSCFAAAGWKGESQVIRLDLDGFAISSGSACSSGKVGPNQVLISMGVDESKASSAIRISIGPATSREQVSQFALRWIKYYKRHCERGN